jgi:hypothetical protein
MRGIRATPSVPTEKACAGIRVSPEEETRLRLLPELISEDVELVKDEDEPSREWAETRLSPSAGAKLVVYEAGGRVSILGMEKQEGRVVW